MYIQLKFCDYKSVIFTKSSEDTRFEYFTPCNTVAGKNDCSVTLQCPTNKIGHWTAHDTIPHKMQPGPICGNSV